MYSWHCKNTLSKGNFGNMTSLREGCPPEIVDQFVQNLDLKDVANLRLTNRPMAGLSTNQSFKARFLVRTVDLTRESLETFVEMT